MTPQDAAHVLEPIWQGFAAARVRLEKLREEGRTARGTMSEMLAMDRHINETQDAEAYLNAILTRFLCPATGGLQTVIEAGKAPKAWPNAFPPVSARLAAEISYHARRFERELRETPIHELPQSA